MVDSPFKISCDSEMNPCSLPGRILNSPLKNGSVSNLAVDGSGTPQDFSLSPSADFGVRVGVITFYVETTDNLALGDKFVVDSISTLTNGLLFKVRSQNVEYTLENCKRTRDLLKLSKGSPDMLVGATSFLRVNLWVPGGILLAKDGTYGTDDFVSVRVQDDLRGLDFAEVFLQGVRVQ